jgi:sulfur relay (sulfurtransferase) DsrC/TusE family protein
LPGVHALSKAYYLLATADSTRIAPFTIISKESAELAGEHWELVMAQHAYWKGYLKLSLSCPSDHQLDGRLAEQHQGERKEASGREHWCATTRALTHGR